MSFFRIETLAQKTSLLCKNYFAYINTIITPDYFLKYKTDTKIKKTVCFIYFNTMFCIFSI